MHWTGTPPSEGGFDHIHLLAVVFLGIILPIVGLLRLRLSAGFWGLRVFGELAFLQALAVLAAAGAGGAALGYPASLWLPPLALAGACGLIHTLSAQSLGWPGWAGQAWVQGWRLESLLLLVGGPVLGLGWAGQIDQGRDLERDIANFSGLNRPEVPLVFHSQASTDRGRPVALFTFANGPVRVQESLAWEEAAIRAHCLTLKVITMTGPNSCNCHGWVFAAGGYLIQGDDVQAILEDNGYQAVTAPEPGDLIVYRNDRGQILHSGIVRLVGTDSLVLVESKWGRVGRRYVHDPDNQPYGTSYVYYRSGRKGHGLRGL